MNRVLCISGKRFSGKDSFGELLCAHARDRGRPLQTFAFADVSKRMLVEAQRALGVEVEFARLLGDRAYKERWRPALTQLTTEALAADPYVFCREVGDRIEACEQPVLITDLRLRVELVHLRPRFSLHVVRLARSDERRSASGWQFDPAVDGNFTETELDDASLWDEVVTNDGSEAELRAKAAAVIDAFFA